MPKFGQRKWNWLRGTSPSARNDELAVLPQRTELARAQTFRLQPVCVRRDVDGGAEARMRDGAVVALEEVSHAIFQFASRLELGTETGTGARRRRRSQPAGAAPRRAQRRAARPRRRGSRRRTGPTCRRRSGPVPAPRRRTPVRGRSAARRARHRRGRTSMRGTGTAASRAGRLRRRRRGRGGGRRSRNARRALSRARVTTRDLSGVCREVGAGLRELSRVADVLPRSREDPLPFASQHFGIGVPGPGKGVFHAETVVSMPWPSRKHVSSRCSSSSSPSAAFRRRSPSGRRRERLFVSNISGQFNLWRVRRGGLARTADGVRRQHGPLVGLSPSTESIVITADHDGDEFHQIYMLTRRRLAGEVHGRTRRCSTSAAAGHPTARARIRRERAHADRHGDLDARRRPARRSRLRRGDVRVPGRLVA